MNGNITGIHDNNIIVDNNLSGTLFYVDANLKSFTILSNDYTSYKENSISYLTNINNNLNFLMILIIIKFKNKQKRGHISIF